MIQWVPVIFAMETVNVYDVKEQELFMQVFYQRESSHVKIVMV